MNIDNEELTEVENVLAPNLVAEMTNNVGKEIMGEIRVSYITLHFVTRGKPKPSKKELEEAGWLAEWVSQFFQRMCPNAVVEVEELDFCMEIEAEVNPADVVELTIALKELQGICKRVKNV